MKPAIMIVPAFVLGFGAATMLAFQPEPTKPEPVKTEPAKADQPAAEPTKDAPKTEKKMVKTPDGKEYEVQSTSQVAVLIEDLKLGTGAEAKMSSVIGINYHGTLAKDGKKFDGNWGDAPIKFPLSDLIQGWQVGIPGMKVGGIRRLTIPWQLAYGERASGPIPAKADLVFLIELKDVR